jgi:transcriptional regulator with XRE-family HTH domain
MVAGQLSFREYLAEQLKKAREQMGWSTQELAQKSGVPEPVIDKGEKAEQVPSIGHLNRLAGALGQAVPWFFPRVLSPEDPGLAELYGVSQFPAEVRQHILLLMLRTISQWQSSHGR